MPAINFNVLFIVHLDVGTKATFHYIYHHHRRKLMVKICFPTLINYIAFYALSVIIRPTQLLAKEPGKDDKMAQIVNQEKLKKTIARCKERGIIIPTFAQQRDPSKVPAAIVERLKNVGLWDINSLNLFRITWHNDAKTGGYGKVNYFELPSSLTGVKARIFGLCGKFFPTGAHKVGASFGCLVPRMVTGDFDASKQKTVWPSTGNYCRGGAYNAKLLGCDAIAILPAQMSKERFDWLKEIGSEVIATPGCESNVKEIYDKCWELQNTRGDDVVILNQFAEFGNGMWHYNVTAEAMLEVLRSELGEHDTLAAFVSATGSAGTIASGDRLKEVYPNCKICASEALQCPTIVNNGFGAHRIEGIGDKHIPWVHNIRNTDMGVAIDDQDCIQVMRLFNEKEGQDTLRKNGIDDETIEKLKLLGISGISNMLTAIKVAKYYELTEHDAIFTVFTDSIDMYQSRIQEAREEQGAYSMEQAYADYVHSLHGQSTANMLELTYPERKRVHNLKYYTWIEQQGKEISELNDQWYDRSYFSSRWRRADEYDKLINEFNQATGLLAALEKGEAPFNK